MSIVYEEPPCKIEDVLTLNFSNLQNFLGSLVNNNKEFYDKISYLTNKIQELDSIKEEVTDTKCRLNKCESKFTSIETTLENHQFKLIDLETKSQNNNIVRKIKK